MRLLDLVSLTATGLALALAGGCSSGGQSGSGGAAGAGAGGAAGGGTGGAAGAAGASGTGGSAGSTDGGTAPGSLLLVVHVVKPPAPGTPETMVWRDGVMTKIDQGDVYGAFIDKAGHSIVSGSDQGPCYWVDGIRVDIDTSIQGVVRGIAQDPTTGDLVFGGTQGATGSESGAYWRQGSSTAKLLGGKDVFAVTVDASGVVYAAGDTRNNRGVVFRDATTLDNKTFDPALPGTNVIANALDVAADGSLDVLLDYNAAAGGKVLEGQWANLVVTSPGISVGLAGYSMDITGMTVTPGGDVYVSGSRTATAADAGANRAPGYFKNGSWVALPPAGPLMSTAGIGVDSGGHVYVGGTLEGAQVRAGYWVDGVWKTVTDGSELVSSVSVMAVR